MLKSELEKLKQEKESNQLKIENFNNASKSLDKLIGSQIPDKSRKGVGFASYNAVPPPPTGLFSLSKFDLSNSGLEEFQQPKFKGYGPKTSKSISEDISNEVRESPDAPLVEELVSADNFEHVQADYNFNQRERVVSGNNLYKGELLLFSLKKLPSAHGTWLQELPKAVNTARPNSAVVNAVRANQVNAVKASAWSSTKEDQGYVDSGCSRHMTGNVYLSDNNMYSVDMKNIVPRESSTYLVAKATLDESMFWHRRLVSPDDYSRITWVFFLATKDETSGILKSFIAEIKNIVDKNVKIIRCDNGTEFKNRVMSEFYEKKGIKKEFSVARTPQQNGDGPKWLFDIDVLTKSMNYVPVVAGTNSNDFVGTEESIGAGHSSKETGYSQDILDSHCRNDGSLF
ncbi:ribonuclease H-like domain-containing protein [Tanacetum coccineum]